MSSIASQSSRRVWYLIRLSRRIWFRASLFSVLAVLTALAGIVLAPYIPSGLSTRIGSDAVDSILTIIASSMLAVTTFSLSTMVTALGAATNNVTPRATRLVIEDSTAQNVLATFIGSFLYSLVGIIALSTGAYGKNGRVVLFVVTIAVVVLIVVTLLRWSDHLSRLGRVAETTEKVEREAVSAMASRRDRPYLGGRPLMARHEVPASARPLATSRIGYVQHLDVGALARLAEGGRIFVNAIPGEMVDPTEPIAWTDGLDGKDDKLRECFTIEDTRSFEQDPRFGAAVLSEVASRALSPAVNDPGTAIDVIGRAVRVLAVWARPREEESAPEYPQVHVPPLDLGDLFDDIFTPIARDGAAVVEVCLRLQKALLTLAKLGEGRYAEHALRHSRQALQRAEAALSIEADKRRVREAAFSVEACAARWRAAADASLTDRPD